MSYSERHVIDEGVRSERDWPKRWARHATIPTACVKAVSAANENRESRRTITDNFIQYRQDNAVTGVYRHIF